MRGVNRMVALAALLAAVAGWGALALAQAQNGPGTGTDKPAGFTPPALPNSAAIPSGPSPAGGPVITAVAPAEPETVSHAGQSPDNPTGRQEPAVSLEWLGPPQTRVGRTVDYTLLVHNVCNTAVEQVVVRLRLPAGMTAEATEPKAKEDSSTLIWDLGTVPAHKELHLLIRLLPAGRGDAACQASVTFTGSAALKIKVTEPRLVLKASAPAHVMAGEAVTVTLAASNPGDGICEQVKVHATISDGLEHPRGHKVDFEIGNLAPGETRNIQLVCGTHDLGEHHCEAWAEADGNLRSQDQAKVTVIVPRLDLEVQGPKLRYLDRKATYVFKVTNPGEAPAANISLQDVIPAGFKFASASDGGRHDFPTRSVSWFLGEIGPGKTKEVKLDVIAINPGEFRHHAKASGTQGLTAEQEITTRVEGLSAILLEVVDTEDPIEVGSETVYEIRITNTGSKTETNIKLVCTIPDKEQFLSSTGPARYKQDGRDVVFEPVVKLAPREEAVFRLRVKGLKAGDVRFKAQITSTNLVEPVLEMESTRIYED